MILVCVLVAVVFVLSFVCSYLLEESRARLVADSGLIFEFYCSRNGKLHRWSHYLWVSLQFSLLFLCFGLVPLIRMQEWRGLVGEERALVFIVWMGAWVCSGIVCHLLHVLGERAVYHRA